MSTLTDIEARIAADRDDFGGGYADQSIRDREALVAMVRELEAAKAEAWREGYNVAVEDEVAHANTMSEQGWS